MVNLHFFNNLKQITDFYIFDSRKRLKKADWNFQIWNDKKSVVVLCSYNVTANI